MPKTKQPYRPAPFNYTDFAKLANEERKKAVLRDRPTTGAFGRQGARIVKTGFVKPV